MTRSLLSGLSSVLLLGLLVACGGRAEAPPADSAAAAPAATSSFDPCTLLTAEEVQAAVGWAVAETTPYPSGDGGRCVYKGADATGLPPQSVDAGVSVCLSNFPCTGEEGWAQLLSSSAVMADYLRNKFKGTSAEALEPKVDAVEGLGVPATMLEMAGQYTLEMVLGDRRIASAETWVSAEATRSLAEKVLARAR